MRRNLKKAVAFVLTAALAFSTPIATNATKVDAEEAVTEIENSNVSYVNPTEAEDIEGIGWWDATNTKTSNYYLVSGSSVDIFIDKTGEGSGVILETSASTGWFTMNLEGTGDGDFWGELINADTKPYNNNIGFANVSTAKITLTREDGQLNVFITNVEDDSVVADLTLDLTCPDEEVLAFYLMGQWGIFKVGPTLESIKSVDEEVVADEEMIADLRVEKMDSAYSIVFNKLVEDAEYEVLVEDNMGNFILPVDNVINWDDLQFDRIYTVTVIATKDGYVTKTANTSFSKQYEYEQCESKNVLETITGTGWWNGSQQSTSKYYVASGQSIDIYVTNKAGDNGILLETASMDGKYFDVNLQATADADIWGELISSKSGTNWMPFPFLGTVKYTISRYGNILYLTGTNVSTREVLTDITFTLDCSDGEILGFYFMAQDGTFEVAPYCNPIETEYVSGTGWWNGYQQSTSKYYVASGQSVDMYVANTDGNNGIMLETSYDGKYFDLNLQDMMAWGDLIIEQTESDLISFPSLGSAKVTLSREGDYLNVLSTNLEDGTTLCDMTFKLDCPQEEVLGFFFMGQDGTFLVGPTLNSIANFIGNAKAVVSLK